MADFPAELPRLISREPILERSRQAGAERPCRCSHTL